MFLFLFLFFKYYTVVENYKNFKSIWQAFRESKKSQQRVKGFDFIV